MNNEENHGFTSFDFITMMVSFVVIAAVTGPIIKKNIQSDQSIDRARVETGNLGRTLLDPKNLQALVAGNNYDRSIASLSPSAEIPKLDIASIKAHLKNGEWEGNISKDPWGSPYHYSFLRNSKGMATHLVVWSDGPNHISETSVHAQLTDANKLGTIDFKGDDLGTVVPIR